MSKYRLQAKEPHKHAVFVGYDGGADSYMLYVTHPFEAGGERAGHVIEWKGTRAREIDTVEELASLVDRYAELDDEMKRTLRGDRLTHVGHGARP